MSDTAHHDTSRDVAGISLLTIIGAFANFLLEAEAEYLCGAALHEHSGERLNYRSGYYKRSLNLRVGKVKVRVPHLRYIHVRPSLCKRFKRVEPLVVGTLEESLRYGAFASRIEELIKVLWTCEFTPQLLGSLVTRTLSLIEGMRCASGAPQNAISQSEVALAASRSRKAKPQNEHNQNAASPFPAIPVQPVAQTASPAAESSAPASTEPFIAAPATAYSVY